MFHPETFLPSVVEGGFSESSPAPLDFARDERHVVFMIVETDIVPDSERRGLIGALPRTVRPYASLMRLARPIGAWLLFWPCAWSVALDGMGSDGLAFILWFGLGAFAIRRAGCVYTDIIATDLEARVERPGVRSPGHARISLK